MASLDGAGLKGPSILDERKAAERGRKRRLIVLGSIFAGMVVPFGVWTQYVDQTLVQRRDSLTAELEREYRDFDPTAAQFAYARALTVGDDPVPALGLPAIRRGKFYGLASPGGVEGFRAIYAVEMAGKRSCVEVSVARQGELPAVTPRSC